MRASIQNLDRSYPPLGPVDSPHKLSEDSQGPRQADNQPSIRHEYTGNSISLSDGNTCAVGDDSAVKSDAFVSDLPVSAVLDCASINLAHGPCGRCVSRKTEATDNLGIGNHRSSLQYIDRSLPSLSPPTCISSSGGSDFEVSYQQKSNENKGSLIPKLSSVKSVDAVSPARCRVRHNQYPLGNQSRSH